MHTFSNYPQRHHLAAPPENTHNETHIKLQQKWVQLASGRLPASPVLSLSHPLLTSIAWRTKPIKQVVTYKDQSAVSSALTKLSGLPPIVTPTEIVKLKSSLKDAALGKAFLLQGGDCAELFDYCEENAIESKIKLLLQMSLVLIWGSNKPVVRYVTSSS